MDKSNWVCIGGKKTHYSIIGSCGMLTIVSAVVSLLMTSGIAGNEIYYSVTMWLFFALFFMLFFGFWGKIVSYNVYINEEEKIIIRIHEGYFTYTLDKVKYSKLENVYFRKHVKRGGETSGVTTCYLLIKYKTVRRKKDKVIILCDLPICESFQFPSQSELEAFTRNEYRFYPRRNLNEAEWIEFNEVTSLMRGGLSVSKKLNLKYEFLM